MTLPLDVAARAVIESHTALVTTEDAWRQRTYGDADEYRAARNAYREARKRHAEAVQAMKESLSSDGVRQAAEAGSPQALALSPNHTTEEVGKLLPGETLEELALDDMRPARPNALSEGR